MTPNTLIDSYAADERAQGEQAALRALTARLASADSGLWITCSELLIQHERLNAALSLLHGALQRFPSDPEVLFTFGAALRLSGDGVSAETVLRQVLAAAPSHDRAHLTLALIHRDRGQNSAAAALASELHRRRGGVELTLYLVDLLRKCRREREAMDLCEVELSRVPNHGRLQFTAGGLALTLGRFDDARTLLLAALDQPEPELGGLMPLALTRRYENAADPDFSLFRHAANSDLATSIRSGAGFALAKASDDVRDYAGAAAALRSANRLKHEAVQWSASEWRQFVAQQIGRTPPPLPVASLADGIIPIFVVGLPRTGTTLVAELLGRHPDTKSRGEMPWISFIARSLLQNPAPPTSDGLRKAADFYLAHLRQDDSPAHWYIDKNPMNFRYIGLIASMLPNAKIIVCERDRRDTALSIWSQSFESEEMDFAYDFTSIQQFAEGHDRLLAHWRNFSGLPIFNLNYERLVSSASTVLAELQAFVGMPAMSLIDYDSSSGRAINTASVWQARQPIYLSSVGRAQSYAELIPELLNFSKGAVGAEPESPISNN